MSKREIIQVKNFCEVLLLTAIILAVLSVVLTKPFELFAGVIAGSSLIVMGVGVLLYVTCAFIEVMQIKGYES